MTSPVEPDAPLAMSISDDENELQLDGGGSASAAAASAAAAAPVGEEEQSDSDDDGEAPARRSRVSPQQQQSQPRWEEAVGLQAEARRSFRFARLPSTVTLTIADGRRTALLVEIRLVCGRSRFRLRILLR